MEIIELSGQIRNVNGKSEVKRLRESNQVPGIIYGKTPQKDTIPFQINRKELSVKVKFPIRRNQLYKISLQGEKQQDALVFLKDWQLNPIRDHWWEHMDFYAIDPKEKVKVPVPLRFTGKCVGITNGGILQTLKREVTLSGLPMDLPDHIEIDVTNLDIGRSLHVNELSPPDKCTIVATSNYALAAVVSPEEEVTATPAAGTDAAATADGVAAPADASAAAPEGDAKAEPKKSEEKK
jgi:large subunit ribosomal protein L25